MDKPFLPHRAENPGRCRRLGLEGNLRRGHGVERFLQILDVERDLAALARDLPLDLGLIVSDLGRVRREGHAPGSPLGTGLQGELGNIRAARREDRRLPRRLEKGIPIKRSRIDDLLIEEGLRWRQQESWFGERVDPDFAKKRGPSTRSIPRLHPAAP